MTITRARPVQTRNIGSFKSPLGQTLYWVRTGPNEPLFGPVNGPHADRQARYVSKTSEHRVAEVIQFVNDRPFVVAYYLVGRKLISGPKAEANSRRVFGG